jgi:hypothetical protein
MHSWVSLTERNLSKGETVPLHAMEAKGERMYSAYSFTTSALDRGEWLASRPGRVLPRGKDPRYPLYRRLAGPQSWSGHRGLRKNPLASVGDRTSIAQSSSSLSDTILTALLWLLETYVGEDNIKMKFSTERCGKVVSTPASNSGVTGIQILAQRPTTLGCLGLL